MARTWLQQIRASQKISQKKLGQLCNISDAAICYFENAQRTPSVSVAKTIADKLNFSDYGLDWSVFFDEKVNETLLRNIDNLILINKNKKVEENV